MPSPFRALGANVPLQVTDRSLTVKNENMEPLILHIDGFWNSPYAFSVFICLKEKGLPFEIREVNLHEQAQRRPEYAAKSVTARVPLLEHGAFLLSESSAIVEYLEDTFAPPRYPALLPAAPRDRARARQIMAWIRSDLMPIREERATHTFLYKHPTRPLSPAGRAAAEKLIGGASAFIPDGSTSLFDTFSIADADLAMMLMRLVGNGDPVPAKISDFVAAQWRRPSVREWVEHERAPYVPY
jgi:glutathione S-transferase